jgi:hypothetical protein
VTSGRQAEECLLANTEELPLPDFSEELLVAGFSEELLLADFSEGGVTSCKQHGGVTPCRLCTKNDSLHTTHGGGNYTEV